MSLAKNAKKKPEAAVKPKLKEIKLAGKNKMHLKHETEGLNLTTSVKKPEKQLKAK
jgi:hypothetical protein